MSRKVVVAHDYVTQRGGAERVVLALLATFPGARLVTSVYAPDRTFEEFREFEIETILPRVQLVGRDPRVAFPVLAAAFGRHRISDADVVIASSSGWAHGVATSAPKVVYCHTPARWLHVRDDYLRGQPLPVRLAALAAAAPLRRWDAAAAASATRYVANSTVVAERIRRAYGIEAEVVHPPSILDPGGPWQRPPGLHDEPFLLTIARGRGYKNAAAVEAAAAAAGVRLVAVGPRTRRPSPTTLHLSETSDAELRWLYANCRGLVAAAYEDFGLTPVEAMSFGKPVLALRGGGYLDSVVEGVTGRFFARVETDELAAALAAFDERDFDAEAIRRHAAGFSFERFGARLREIVESIAPEAA